MLNYSRLIEESSKMLHIFYVSYARNIKEKNGRGFKELTIITDKMEKHLNALDVLLINMREIESNRGE